MNSVEMAQLLRLVSEYDNRSFTVETVDAWLLIAKDMRLDVAIQAVLMFFSRPVSATEGKRVYFTPNELAFWYRKARDQREVEEARNRSMMTPQQRKAMEHAEEQARIRAIDAKVATAPPKVSPVPEFEVEKLAANRARLSELMNRSMRDVPKDNS